MSIPSSSSATSSNPPPLPTTSTSLIPSNTYASISGSLYLSRLSKFIHTHERALASYYPPPKPQSYQTTTSQGGGGGPSWSTILSLGILPSEPVPSSSTSSSSSSALVPRDRLVLSFNPHHLYYVLLKFDELGFSTGDSLDVKLFNEGGGKDWSKPLMLNHTTVSDDGTGTGRLEIIREGNAPGRSQSLFSGFFGGNNNNNYTTTTTKTTRKDDEDSKSSFSFGSGWWGLGGGKNSNSLNKSTQEEDESSLVKHIYSSCTKLPALKLSPFIFLPPSKQRSSTSTSSKSLPSEAISGFEDCPPRLTCVPLSIFHSLTSLYLQDLDPRSFTGWENLSIQLKKLELVRSGIEDVCELVCDCVVEDEQRSIRRKNGETLSQEFVGQIRNKRRTTTTTKEEVEDETSSSSYPEPSKLAWSSLRHLSLHDNSLTFIPLEPLSHLTLLTSLDLSSNLLISVPPSLSQLPFLRSLNLRDNMIDNLHSLPTILGAIEVLNLSENRLENLSGLDRLLALERLDLRNNRVWECLEISRLSRLNNLKELWVEGNPFSRGIELGGEEGWRIKCWSYFLEERTEEEEGGELIKIDGRGLNSKNERKLVELEVSKRTGGNFQQRVRRRASTTRLQDDTNAASTKTTTNGGGGGGVSAKKVVVVEPRRRVVTAPNLDRQRQISTNSTQLSTSPNLSSSPPTRSSQPHHHHQRRKPRRIVDLDTPPSSSVTNPNNVQAQQSDSDATTTATSSGPESNVPPPTTTTMLTPSKVRQQQPSTQKFNSSPSRIRHSSNLNDTIDSSLPSSSSRSRRDRVSTSTYEESTSELMTPTNSGGGGEALRKKIEKLREEVGENWLSVLGEREARAAALLEVEKQERQQKQEQEQQKAIEDDLTRTRGRGEGGASELGQADSEREIGERREREEPSIEGLTVSAGVKVVKKKGKKKKGKGAK